MHSFWNTESRPASDPEVQMVSREVSRLLEEQELLLDRPMSTTEMMLYEVRSEQISELVDQLSKTERREKPQ